MKGMKHALLSATAGGAFWLLFLFFVCFFCVHTARLARMGWQARKTPPTSEKNPPGSGNNAPGTSHAPEKTTREQPERREPDSPVPAAPEPVYYIVGRKRKKAKSTYSPPREIRFK